LTAKEDDIEIIYDQLLVDYGAVTFQAYINLLVRAFTSPT